MRIKWETELRANPLKKRFFTIDLTNDFIQDLKFRSKGENHFIIECLGQTGSGKSIAMLILGLVLNTETGKDLFNLDNLSFEKSEMIKKIKDNFKKDSIYILDEQTVGVGLGSEREEQEQQNLEEITRKAGLSLIFNSPTPRKHGTAHYRLEFIKRDDNERYSFFGVLLNTGGYNYIPVGFVKFKIAKENQNNFKELWKDYNKRKDIFIERIMQQKELQRLDYKDMARMITEHEDYFQGMKKGELCFLAQQLFGTKTTSEVDFIATAVKIYYKKHWEKQSTDKVKQKEKKGLLCTNCWSSEIRYNSKEEKSYCRRCGGTSIKMFGRGI